MKINFNDIRHNNEKFYLILSILMTLILIFSTNLFGGFFYALIFLILIIFYIRITQKKYLGNALKVGDKHFYRIKVMVDDLCERVGIEKPEVYIKYDSYPNAYTIGFFYPYTIVLTSALIENLTEEELETVIAHELGHVYFHHTRISTLFNIINKQENNFLFSLFYQLTLIGFWNRATEYTCDNFALLLTKNPQAIISTLIKINISIKYEDKIDEDEIIKQFRLYKQDFFSILGELNETHPYFVKRVNNVINLYQKFGHEYFKKNTNIYCYKCGKKLEPNSKYCIYCGQEII